MPFFDDIGDGERPIWTAKTKKKRKKNPKGPPTGHKPVNGPRRPLRIPPGQPPLRNWPEPAPAARIWPEDWIVKKETAP